MDAALKERAHAISKLSREGRRKAGALPEIKEVHYLLYGSDVDCTFCNVDELVRRISLKLIQQPLIIKDMKNAKGRFTQSAKGNTIIRHTKNGTIAITEDNLNEGDNFEWVASQKVYAHNVEEIPSEAKKKESEESAPAKAEVKTTTTTAKK